MAKTPLPPMKMRHLLDGVTKELVLKPLLENYLIEARFPDRFEVTFHKAGVARAPDNWFHPSTHPLWSERQLFYYVTKPDLMASEQFGYEQRMAVTMGTAVGAFFEMCIRDAGMMIPLAGECEACGRPHGPGSKKRFCDQFGANDPVLGRRGHMDGIVAIQLTGKDWQPGIGLLEFKTCNPMSGKGLTDNGLEHFRAKWPEYYAQVQEYMELTGLRQAVVIFAVLGYPWRIVEIQVPYDVGHAMEVKAKYRRVREAVADDILPDPCCVPRSATARSCPARFACPVGRMS